MKNKMVTIIADPEVDLKQLNLALRRFRRPVVREVNTGGNWEAYVVAEKGTTTRQAQAFHDKEMREMCQS